MKMINQLKEAFALEDLRKRFLFMIYGFAIFMIGRVVPLPDVNAEALANLFGQADNLFGVLNMFSGGALERMSIFALGVMPYINASIMFQLLTVAVPSLKQLQQEGQTGRDRISGWTRWLTVGLAMFQAFGLASMLRAGGAMAPGVGPTLQVMLTLAAGSMFILWLGEQMTEKGIGNGVSLMIFIGIMAELPSQLWQTAKLVRDGAVRIDQAVLLGVIVVATVAGCVAIQQGERKITVQYARRVVGTRMMGGASTYLPMKVNQAGVMPIIFAISVIYFPRTIVQFVPGKSEWWLAVQQFVQDWLDPSMSTYKGWFALLVYFALVVAFTYFYTAVTYDPTEVADNLKKYGGQIKGIRAGSETARYIDKVLTRITFAGAVFLGVIALMPYLVPALTHIQTFGLVGGTSLLIVVGVALDTMQQVEAHLLMRHYKGFID